MLRKLGLINRSQKGFTLIEMIVAIAISSAIGGGVLFSIYQTATVQAIDKARMNCVKNLENAIHYIVQDAQMAQKIETDADADGLPFPLVLTWVEWDNTKNEVTYSILKTSDELKRSHSINDGDPQENILARYIDWAPTKTNCGYTGDVLTVKLTATITGFPEEVSETRDIEIKRRTDW